jgi:hypothetical protein
MNKKIFTNITKFLNEHALSKNDYSRYDNYFGEIEKRR